MCKSVAIIGAGASGLISAKVFLRHGWKVTLYEARDQIGGLWNYSSKSDKYAIPNEDPNYPLDVTQSACYDELNVNVPKDMLGYASIPYPLDQPLFPSRQQFLKYIVDSGRDVEPHVKFNTLVTKISQEPSDQASANPKWSVKSLTNNTSSAANYDHLILTTGNYNVPFSPAKAGTSLFEGETLHAKEFRQASKFANQKVLLVGVGSSGLDISQQLSRYVDKLYISVRRADKDSVTLYPGTKASLVGDVTFDKHSFLDKETGESHPIDTVIFCTGYLYSYPMLDPKLGIITDGNRIRQNYLHLFYNKDPSLAFLNISQLILPLRFAEVQANYLYSVWSGAAELPSYREMLQWEEDRIKEAGDGRSFVKLGDLQDLDYEDNLVSKTPGSTIPKRTAFERRYREVMLKVKIEAMKKERESGKKVWDLSELDLEEFKEFGVLPGTSASDILKDLRSRAKL